jgi:hypothetical protein
MTPFDIEVILTAAALLALFFGFGALLKVSDLLQEHGFRWFPASSIAVGAAATALCLTGIALGGTSVRLFWLAVVLHWVLRGRIDGVNHGLMATAILFAVSDLLPLGPLLDRFLYFFVPLVLLGLVHDHLQYSAADPPRAIAWFFANQHLYWYLIAFGYAVLFAWDLPFLAGVYGFVKGYGFFYDASRHALLARVGITRDPPG